MKARAECKEHLFEAAAWTKTMAWLGALLAASKDQLYLAFPVLVTSTTSSFGLQMLGTSLSAIVEHVSGKKAKTLFLVGSSLAVMSWGLGKEAGLFGLGGVGVLGYYLHEANDPAEWNRLERLARTFFYVSSGAVSMRHCLISLEKIFG